MRTLAGLFLGSVAFAMVAPAAAAPTPQPELDVTPTPAWVEPRELPAVPPPAPGEPVRELLLDDQYDLASAQRAHYVRTARAVSSIVGIDAISQVELSFDPSYERLAVHGLRIWRDGTARDALAAATSRSYFSESSSENRIYDGAKTLLFVLKDVRVGDIVELEFSRIGSNPVFGNAFSGTVPLAGSRRWAERHLRFLTAPEHAPHVTVFAGAPEARSTLLPDGKLELRWDAKDVAAIDYEDETPSSYAPTPRVTVSDFASWEAVGKWARPLFESVQAPDPTLDAVVRRLREEHPDDRDARALAAIRFVQDEIRYLGMEMGEHSFRPHPPKDVLAGRFGDCKDKATFLVALLRGLGEEAHVALVSTRAGRALQGLAPSAVAFNHAIVALERPDGRLWIDATQNLQGGSLATMSGPDFGWALLLSPAEGGLVAQEARPLVEPSFVESELYRREGQTNDVVLVFATTYRDGEADDERNVLAHRARESLTRSLLEHRAVDHDVIEIAAPLAIVDRRDENEIVVTETYRLPGYLDDPSVPFRAEAVRGVLPHPGPLARKAPLALRYPYFARHTIAFELGRRVDGLPRAQSLVTPDCAFRVERPADGDVVHFDLRMGRASLPAAEVASVNETVRKIDAVTAGQGKLARSSTRAMEVLAIFTLGGAGLFVVLVLAAGIGTKGGRLRKWRKKLRLASGETPTTALALSSEFHARAHAATRACACGRKGSENIELRPLRLGDALVTSIAVACACGSVNRTYYRLP